MAEVNSSNFWLMLSMSSVFVLQLIAVALILLMLLLLLVEASIVNVRLKRARLKLLYQKIDRAIERSKEEASDEDLILLIHLFSECQSKTIFVKFVILSISSLPRYLAAKWTRDRAKEFTSGRSNKEILAIVKLFLAISWHNTPLVGIIAPLYLMRRISGRKHTPFEIKSRGQYASFCENFAVSLIFEIFRRRETDSLASAFMRLAPIESIRLSYLLRHCL